MGKTNKKLRGLHTVQIESTLRDLQGNVTTRRFIHYGSPSDPAFARSIAASLKRINRSYRIVENDGQPDESGQIKVVDMWCRAGWEPTTEKTGD